MEQMAFDRGRMEANYWLGVDRRNAYGIEARLMDYPGAGNFHYKTAYMQGIRDAEKGGPYRPYQP